MYTQSFSVPDGDAPAAVKLVSGTSDHATQALQEAFDARIDADGRIEPQD